MSRKLLFALAAVLGSILIYSNTDWFAKRPIRISHRFHSFAGRFGGASDVAPVLFEFDRKVQLTSIKIIAVSDLQSNRVPQPIWQLVADSRSAPTKGFVYGMEVPGMRPVYKGVAPGPLDPTQTYRLLLEVGSLKAQHDFCLDPSAR
jgi:hypothetical protein